MPANIQAIDLLLLPNSTSICLERFTRIDGRFSGNFTVNVATAKAWQRRDEVDGKLLQGEILLPAGTRTDFTFPYIELGVSFPEPLHYFDYCPLSDDFSYPILHPLFPKHRVSLAICAPGVVISTTKPPISLNQRLPPSRQHQTVLSVPVKLVNASRAGDPQPPSYAPVPAYNEESEPSSPYPRSSLTIRARRGFY
jgi:hypothetical protein